LELNLLLEQLRQLKVADQNALDIYKELQSEVEDKTILRSLDYLVREETKHVAMDKEIMSIIKHEYEVFFSGGKTEGDEIQKMFEKASINLVSGNPGQLLKDRKGSKRFDLVILDLDRQKQAGASRSVPGLIRKLRKTHKKVIVLSSRRDFGLIRKVFQAGTSDFIPKPFNQRELMARALAVLRGTKRICCLGGGTGLFTLLGTLKVLPDILLISLVNMSDDGGSSGRLRSSFGILPPGDVRRSLVALSNAPEVMNELIRYRFDRGGALRDHSLGNLLLTGLVGMKGSMAEAVRALGDILNIQGIVLPITQTLTEFCARFENGKVVCGESRISLCKGRNPGLQVRKVWHEPRAVCDASAYASILHADVIIIGPGDLYTSVITNLVIGKVSEAISLTRAKKIYICNLMTRPGETSGLNAGEHVSRIVQVLGKDLLDYVLISNTRFSKAAVSRYARLNQHPVLSGGKEGLRDVTKAKGIFADIADQKELVRHDFQKLRAQLLPLLS
jgi:uncharacterized cofD-like protein